MRVWLIQKLISINEYIFFYPKLKKIYSLINFKGGPIIFDIGANRGQSIEFFISIYPNSTIYAFEPNKKLYEKLKTKYTNNKNIILENKGVSDKDGILNFNINIMDETSTFEKVNSDSKYLQKKARILGKKSSELISETYKVEVVALSTFLKNKNIDNVDILKIDVEGHEMSVLEGLFKEELTAKLKYIQIENHEDDMYNLNYKQLEHILLNNNMKEYKKVKHGFGELYEIIFKATT